MSLFAELKRRNVFRVVVLYVITSWVILQAADVLTGLLPVPEWTGSMVFLLLLLGFPLVVAFSWVYEITPDGIRLEKEIPREQSIARLTGRRLDILIGTLAVLAIIIVIVDRSLPDRKVTVDRTAAQPTGETAGAGSQDFENSIAVLPFVDMSEGGDQAYFSDGLSEELLNLLTKMPELKVASRTSSFSFRGTSMDLPGIATRLGVRYVLEGSVRKQGEKLRITAQLIDAQTNFHKWSETYDRRQDDIFDIQDDIARNVVGALQLVLSNQSEAILSQQETSNIDAFEAYLRGKSFLRIPVSDETLASAEQYFNQAIELDGKYAGAHAGLCDTNIERYNHSFDMTAFAQAELSCNRALTLSPRDASVLTALGRLYSLSGQNERAEQSFLRAIELDDRAADAYTGLARVYENQNRLEDVRIAYEKALEIQPGYWRGHMALGGFLFRTGRSDEAVRHMQKAVELSPENPRALNSLGTTLYMLGKFDQARDAWYRSLQIDPTPIAYSNLGTASFLLHDYEQAAAMYTRALELTPEDYQLWGALGDAYRFIPGKEQLSKADYRKATELAEDALALNAEDAFTTAAYAYYCASTGRSDEASLYLPRAVALAPDNMYVHYYAALTAATEGDAEAAVEASRHAIESGYPAELLRAEPLLAPLAEREDFHALLTDDGDR